MKVSVVTNAFNQGRYLAAAAESVLGQTGCEIEYVINDPGSTDNTAAVIAALEHRFPGRFIVRRDPDAGPADGLNQAFAQCSGDWFIYLNADDLFLHGAFAQAVPLLERHSAAGAVIGNGYLVEEDGTYIRRAISTPFTARRFVYGGAFALQQSTFYRAEAFRAVGGFNVTNRTSWDAEILLDLERAGFSRSTVGGYWSLFRMQPESITVSQRLAEESARNHARFFLAEMGREKRASDRYRTSLTRLASRLAQPGATIARVVDQIAPRKLCFAEAQAPDWAAEL